MNSLATDTSTLVTVVKAVMGLFTEFPLNIIIVGSIAGLAFGIFRKAKKASH